jgi:hypothetical protein
MMSIPTQLKMMPKEAMISDFIMGPREIKDKRINPVQMMQKYSAGPNWRANSARGWASSIRPIKPRVPAMKEPNAAIPKAGPALPLRAI